MRNYEQKSVLVLCISSLKIPQYIFSSSFPDPKPWNTFPTNNIYIMCSLNAIKQYYTYYLQDLYDIKKHEKIPKHLLSNSIGGKENHGFHFDTHFFPFLPFFRDSPTRRKMTQTAPDALLSPFTVFLLFSECCVFQMERKFEDNYWTIFPNPP